MSERVEGGTTRGDGSVRRVVRIRQGFQRQEDIQRYNVRDRIKARREKEATTSHEQLFATTPTKIQDSNIDSKSNSKKDICKDMESLTSKVSRLDVSPKVENHEPSRNQSKSTPLPQDKNLDVSKNKGTNEFQGENNRRRKKHTKQKKYSLAELESRMEMDVGKI
ncbi:unnamed protein product [Ambrosiozyma monospora]|uniref:Unnamed protein product n=1 Tax=Ambrosiozyma monospora TaxID=43982 RepID=A0A9W6Z2I2_AMBMO|nr:unnamed protein product [Ambrosiozyma monospora]